MTIAIILASYNGEKYIEEQLRSIIEQRGVETDIYVYDDASKDATVKIVERMIDLYPHIFLNVRKTPSGSAFKNFNLAVASFDPQGYDYVGFADQDDIWLQDKLINQVTTLCESGAVGCSTNVEAFFEDGSRVTIDNAGRQTSLDQHFQGGGQGCTYLMTTQFFRELQQAARIINQPTLPHDWFAYAYARTRGYTWNISSVPMIRYRQHANVFGARSGYKGLFKRLQMLASGDFVGERRALTDALQRVIPTDPCLEQLNKVQDRVAERILFAVKHCLAFRRSTSHAIVVASMFAVGRA